MSSYVYTPLRKDVQDAFRLLTILPSAEDGTIHVELEETTLEAAGEFSALSYTWGDPMYHPYEATANIQPAPLDHTIKCNSLDLSVTENLFNALRVIGRRVASEGTDSMYLWADMICICQQDHEERGQQVQMMSRIYSNATKVIAWLGPAGEDYQEAAKFIDEVASLSKTGAVNLGDPYSHIYTLLPYNPILAEKYGITASTEATHYSLLGSFFYRSWFRRAWVVQETVAARNLLVLCGNHEIDWVELRNAVVFLNLSHFSSTLIATLLGGKHTKATALPRSNLPILRNVFRGTGIDLVEILKFCRTYESTDPRDKVLGFLGLTDVDTQAEIKPRYDCPVVDIYVEATKSIVLRSSTLRVLSLVEDRAYRKVMELPSWCPDYSVWHNSSNLTDLEACLRGSWDPLNRLEMQQPRKPSFDSHVMSVRGLLYDVVTKIGENFEEITHYNGFLKIIDILNYLGPRYPTGESTAEVLWRAMIANKDHPNDDHPASTALDNAFSQFLLYYSSMEGKELDECDCVGAENIDSTQEAFIRLARSDPSEIIPGQENYNSWSEWYKSDGNGQSPITGIHQFIGSLIDVYVYRRLFLTGKNFLGITSQSCLPGDSVVFLVGAKVPFVLRKMPNGRYQVVGEAYVHGVMEGEGVDKDSELVTIELE